MNHCKTPSLALRAASLLASVCVTALIVGSQFGIAGSYTDQADARLAQAPQPAVAQPSASAPQRRS